MTAEKHETKFQAVKRHGKAGTIVLLIGAVPAILGAWQSYETSKKEADTGYQVLVAESKRQGEAVVAIQKNIEEVQKEGAETRRLLFQVLLARASGSGYGRGVSSPEPAPAAALPQPPPAPAPVLRPIGQYKSLELPATLDMAQRPSNLPAPIRAAMKKE